MKGGYMNIKKLLLTIGIIIVGMAVVAGGIFGIYYLMGGFEEKVIAIKTLYFENPDNPDDTTIKEMEVRTLEDFQATISFLPADANRKTLKVSSTTSNTLDNFPSEVTAGEPFDVKVAKDEFGNNIGGAVKLKFTDQSGQAVCYIKVALFNHF